MLECLTRILGIRTRQVISMYAMFRLARAFNKPIGSWDTSQVLNMNSMFCETFDGFNQDIGDWDRKSVTLMTYMFYKAYTFSKILGTGIRHRDEYDACFTKLIRSTKILGIGIRRK